MFGQFPMNGPIAQMVALVCHANAFLRGLSIPEFFANNSTCRLCDRVSFFSLSRKLFGKTRETEVASSPDEWFEHLKRAEIPEVGLCCASRHHPGMPESILATCHCDDRGTWSIKVSDPKARTGLWRSNWEVWNQQAPAGRIWRVAYDRFGERECHSDAFIDVDGSVVRLRTALQAVYTFSDKHDCSGATIFFARALETLDSRWANLHGLHQDLAPEGCLPPLARRLLDACQSAWVFDPDSPWTPVKLDAAARAEFARVSDRLFVALNEAIYAGANSSCASRTNYACERS